MAKKIDNNPENGNAIKSEIREWTESIIIALILAIFIRAFFIQAFKIPSGSMRPTLIERDRLMVNKLRYGPLIPFTKIRLPGFSKIKRGDVIVFVYPQDKKRDFIKRVIGLPREMLEISEGDIYINGKMIDDPLIKNRYYYNRENSQYGKPGQIIEIPSGQVFVLGDNSQSSHDSRYWGFVPMENIIGKAEFIYWPFNRMRLIK
ncbi:MAG: signal peptidase I [Omnitrophica WOR_2 bacterium GWF2_38_59]|nr:MAG: signal peptidase I [Omnitrophica WOR_2 bacterium GWF2_38_59]OGX46818.1 MAG: signal peptidase I [Omnitrophica WOR_2 bacterium RIFOXYA2_FULL_38_17]OGX51618.1 MAG: signal peptidase I [Omnitrophica WOR_2 bacterium RIFOXYA12_FULL_38_10]OGX58786.1 MAG: signal peptidase I [Omnitrophica WOR_2 bacterium RIFOXYC2_FULL_38_12]OGX59659.1 MAG: signal peptidase I [Omnitrophica WOR_2 bacterium RIFOXYB2_FULL_38_16]HBG61503.1 signal peptidase I [Candidatus Omnitrophota bacterium]